VAVASAGPYAPDRQPHQHPTTLFFTGRMPFLPPNKQERKLTVIIQRSPKVYTVQGKYEYVGPPYSQTKIYAARVSRASSCPHLTSATNPPAAAAAVDRRDRQTHGRTLDRFMTLAVDRVIM